MFVYELTDHAFESSCYHLNLALVSSKEFLNFQVTTDCRFTLKRVRDMIIKYSQINVTDNFYNLAQLFGKIGVVVERSLTKWSKVQVCSCHLNFKYHVCFENRIEFLDIKATGKSF